MTDENDGGTVDGEPRDLEGQSSTPASSGPEFFIPPELNQALPGETAEQKKHRLAMLREHLAQLEASRLAAIAKVQQLPGEVLPAIERSRESRLRTEAINKQPKPIAKRFLNSATGKLIRTGIEMIPFPVALWWGPGDIVTAIEAYRRKDIAGNQLDKVDTTIHWIAALVPILPATPIISLVHKIRPKIEDFAHSIGIRRKTPTELPPPASPHDSSSLPPPPPGVH